MKIKKYKIIAGYGIARRKRKDMVLAVNFLAQCLDIASESETLIQRYRLLTEANERVLPGKIDLAGDPKMILDRYEALIDRYEKMMAEFNRRGDNILHANDCGGDYKVIVDLYDNLKQNYHTMQNLYAVLLLCEKFICNQPGRHLSLRTNDIRILRYQYN